MIVKTSINVDPTAGDTADKSIIEFVDAIVVAKGSAEHVEQEVPASSSILDLLHCSR